MLPVILLGSGNSGSSAIRDYLTGRGDVEDPLDGQEFALIQTKGGLSDLHRALTTEYFPANATYALIEFRKLARRLGRTSKKWRIPPTLGYGFSQRIPGYSETISDFIEDITETTWKKYTLLDKLRFSTIDWLFYKLGLISKTNNISYKKPLPVTADEFMESVELLFNRLFYNNSGYNFSNDSHLVFDQAGSFWSPVSSTRYFGNPRRVIVVSRHPRDIYAQFLRDRKTPGKTAAEFAQTQKAHLNAIDTGEWADRRVLHIQFEKFVIHHAQQVQRICEFLDLDHRVSSDYNPEESKQNVHLYQQQLSPQQQQSLTENLPWPPG